MKIAVLGSGFAGRTLAAGLTSLGTPIFNFSIAR